jgi:hypothetical protein
VTAPVRLGDDRGMNRFQDPGSTLWRFSREILVVCPSCDGTATIRPESAQDFTTRRLTCTGCAHTAEWTARPTRGWWDHPEPTGPVEPWFGRPLKLRARCRGHVLWAYNLEHLDLLEGYLAAGLRIRGTTGDCQEQTMLARLPTWLKSAKNRGDVLGTIRHLRAAV